jgi:hypothetical protein
MMPTVFKYVWRKLGGINFTVWLCFLLTLDLGFAYFTLEKNLPVFAPLGDVGLFKWAATYGLYNLKATAWFFILMILLALLGVNTFICTTDRVLPLLNKEARRPGWFMRLGPHVMHYAVLVILSGYLCSYVFSTSLPGRALKPGAAINMPGGAGTVTFLGYEPVYYRGGRLDFFTDYILDPNAMLELRDAEGRKTVASLAFNRPVGFQGFKIYLSNFYPRLDRQTSMGLNYIRLTLRQDRSSAVYLAGLALFLAGLGLYVFEGFNRKVKT